MQRPTETNSNFRIRQTCGNECAGKLRKLRKQAGFSVPQKKQRPLADRHCERCGCLIDKPKPDSIRYSTERSNYHARKYCRPCGKIAQIENAGRKRKATLDEDPYRYCEVCGEKIPKHVACDIYDYRARKTCSKKCARTARINGIKKAFDKRCPALKNVKSEKCVLKKRCSVYTLSLKGEPILESVTHGELLEWCFRNNIDPEEMKKE